MCEKENLRIQKVISYKEHKLSQCTGKQNYVIKNEENSDYYYLSNRKIRRKMIEVVFSSPSAVSLLAFYFRESFKRTNGSLTEEKDIAGSAKVISLGMSKKYLLITEYKRVLIQPGERRRNQLTNKSNAQSEKYSPLWKCSKHFIPPHTDGMICFSSNIVLSPK